MQQGFLGFFFSHFYQKPKVGMGVMDLTIDILLPSDVT